ncbi:MAG: helix-turn-helix transcriptional regulator [Bordetella sp.]|nr:helix-turn-helix transcriptional regulator [Bordetella sp.]
MTTVSRVAFTDPPVTWFPAHVRGGQGFRMNPKVCMHFAGRYELLRAIRTPRIHVTKNFDLARKSGLMPRLARHRWCFNPIHKIQTRFRVFRVDTFGHRLRNARMLHGWTQKDLALASKLSQSAIGNYESGLRLHPSGEALIKLTRALRVAPLWLSSGEGPMLARDAEALARRYDTFPPAAGCGGPGGWPFLSVPFSDYEQLSSQEKCQLEQVLAAYIGARAR